MRVDVGPDDVFVKRADARGRITIGSEFAGESLELAILDRGDRDE